MGVILVVDDDKDTLALVQLAFQAYDPAIEVRTADTCLEALQVLDTGRVECIFIDQRLSGSLSGTECVRRMRERLFDGAIVILTGFLEEKVVSESIRFGADDFVLKQSDMRAALIQSYEAAMLRRVTIRQSYETTRRRFAELERIADLLDSTVSGLRQHLKRQIDG